MKSPRVIIQKFEQSLTTLLKITERLDEIKINQGLILSQLNENKHSRNLKDFEFKVFSQRGEDGIIQHLTKTVDIKNRTFIEFGVEDFLESNCRFLMMKDDWRGFVIDGSGSKLNKLKKSYFYWRHDLVAFESFITRENINELLAKSGFDEDLGILSVDLDGNDYHVLEAITFFKPRILICEFNAVFGPTRKISTPYDPRFFRTAKHYSNLYFGASLSAMTFLANKKGYSLVGTNSISSNAFFVRHDLLNPRLDSVGAEQAFVPSNVREGRDERGNLSYVSRDERLKVIEGLPVLNVETNGMEAL
jgi:hypothetical protein